MIWRSVLLWIFASLVSGCANMGEYMGMGKDMNQERMTQMQVVAVASLQGRHLMYGARKKNMYEPVLIEVPQWRVREKSMDWIVGELQKNPQYKKVAPFTSAQNFSKMDIKTITLQLAVEAKEQGFDTLVLVVPTRYEGDGGLPPDYGVKHIGALVSQKDVSTHVFNMATLHIIDTRTGEEMGWKWAYGRYSTDPHIESDENVPWNEDFKSLSSSEQDQIRDALYRLIEKQMIYGVRALQLDGKKR